MKTEKLEVEGLPALERCWRAIRTRDRVRGLLGRDGLAPGEGMLFPRCNAIHTVGMKFPIDVAFLGRDGRPVKLVRSVPPGRLLVWGGWRARTTVEAAAGWIPPSAPHGRARDCAAARGLLESGPPNGTRAARAPGDPAT